MRSFAELYESFGGFDNFMLSYQLKPYERADRWEAHQIAEALLGYDMEEEDQSENDLNNITADEPSSDLFANGIQATVGIFNNGILPRSRAEADALADISYAKEVERLREIACKCDASNCPNKGIKTTKTCSRCRIAKYCSKECQTAHWKIHKKDCSQPVPIERSLGGKVLKQYNRGTRCRLKQERIDVLLAEGRELSDVNSCFTILRYVPSKRGKHIRRVHPRTGEVIMMYDEEDLPSYIIRYDDSPDDECAIPCEDLEDDYIVVTEK